VTMNCGRARRLLWPDAGPRETTAEVVAAGDHVAGCEGCSRFLEDMRRMADSIRRDAPRPTAPAEVRDRLFQAIARARTASGEPARRSRLRQMAIAGSAALLVLGLSLLAYLGLGDRSPYRSDTLGSIVEDQLRTRQGAGLASSDSLRVTEWLAERLPFAVQIPIFPEARLAGARLLLTGRQSGAVVEYRIHGRELTYYVVPGAGPGVHQEIRLVSRNGYRVASWHDAGMTHALVGFLPGAKLVELARYCIHQMMV
jgi:anti-sigma factor RsiW